MITYTARFRSVDKVWGPDLIREFGGTEGRSFDFVYSEKTIENAKSDQDAIQIATVMAKNDGNILLKVVKTITLYQA